MSQIEVRLTLPTASETVGSMSICETMRCDPASAFTRSRVAAMVVFGRIPPIPGGTPLMTAMAVWLSMNISRMKWSWVTSESLQSVSLGAQSSKSVKRRFATASLAT